MREQAQALHSSALELYRSGKGTIAPNRHKVTFQIPPGVERGTKLSIWESNSAGSTLNTMGMRGLAITIHGDSTYTSVNKKGQHAENKKSLSAIRVDQTPGRIEELQTIVYQLLMAATTLT